MMEGIMASHVQLRLAQRNLSPAQVEYVLDYGVEMQRTGITFYVLHDCDVPAAHRRHDMYAKRAGTVLLVAPDGTLIIAYRNHNAPHRVSKKRSYRC